MTSASERHKRLTTLSTYQSISNARLKSLYSDFLRQKQSNPTSYASNLEWWRQTLETVVSTGWQYSEPKETDRLVLHASPSLVDLFRFEGVGKPLSLAGVIADLMDSKEYYPLTQFLNSSQSIYDPGWLPYRIAAYVVGKPLWWALQQLSLVPDDTAGGHESDSQRWKKVSGSYVLRNLVEKAAEGVLAKQRRKSGASLADSLYKFESFKRTFADAALEGVTVSDLDMKVILRYLERDKRVVLVQGDTIKFVDSSDSDSAVISAVDTGLLELKTGVERLEAQVDNIQYQIEQRTEKISAALRRKQKDVALTLLRSRKQLEDLLKKRLASLDTLQSTLLRVEAAAGDVEIMRSYESSTATLRAILAHPSLQREQIDETMEAMYNANADARDIDEAIQMGTEIAQGDIGIDNADLEDELQALVKEAERNRQDTVESKQLARMEDDTLRVPSHAPGVSEESWTDQEIDDDFQKVRAGAI
ncbi:hypothetical protein K474DRAFT_1585221 [Panus rudis PR-1116 ss-1]|nr:hypothetical protein K474DRAFT_1585221 [Panus rudis PR-1116 ss-1]